MTISKNNFEIKYSYFTEDGKQIKFDDIQKYKTPIFNENNVCINDIKENIIETKEFSATIYLSKNSNNLWASGYNAGLKCGSYYGTGSPIMKNDYKYNSKQEAINGALRTLINAYYRES
ncbi:MAG: hypothetical protein RLZZ414_1381, partial [Bacteroidota bacterium]